MLILSLKILWFFSMKQFRFLPLFHSVLIHNAYIWSKGQGALFLCTCYHIYHDHNIKKKRGLRREIHYVKNITLILQATNLVLINHCYSIIYKSKNSWFLWRRLFYCFIILAKMILFILTFKMYFHLTTLYLLSFWHFLKLAIEQMSP